MQKRGKNRLTEEYKTALRRDPCSYCGGVGGTVDHIIPKALGGRDHSRNLTGACLVCNRSKNQMGMLRFLVETRL